MDLLQNLFLILILILVSSFFSIAEISLAGARRVKLQSLSESGDVRADKILNLQTHSADFFATSQIGLNAVAILGGSVGEGALRPYFSVLIGQFYQGQWLESIAFFSSFVLVTLLFILYADLIPKRIAMINPERAALAVINPVLLVINLVKPLAWFINVIANATFRIFNINTTREDSVTFDDVSAIMEAGAEAGVVLQQEQHLIENVFELEERTVPSSMTARDDVVFFTMNEPEDSIRQKIADYPYSKFLVCNEHIDQVIGYVDTKDILMRILNHKSSFQLNEAIIRNVLIIPDTLTLSELLDRFRASKDKIAVVVNEYALVVGLITLSDVMMTVMGDWVVQETEDLQIIKRSENSWLIDGLTPIDDVKHALEIDEFPDWDHYETLAGFIMYRLRKIPRPADWVEHAGYKFEVVDIDHYKIDQLLVTRLPTLSSDEVKENLNKE
ncbi:MAG: hemolysin family protein [Moraxella sp.]